MSDDDINRQAYIAAQLAEARLCMLLKLIQHV